MNRYDVSILGSGIVGKTLALMLGRMGLNVALSAPATAPSGAAATEDLRAYALSSKSIQLLRAVKAWDGLPEAARTAVYDMAVHGDGSSPGQLGFSAWDQHVRELAWIVDAQALDQSLARALEYQPHVTLVDREVDAALVAICEGKFSAAREARGVHWDRHAYGQTAIAARLVSDQPHRGLARQWFRSPDILALLPFAVPEPGRSYGLVWSLPEAEARRLLETEPAEFEQALNEATGGVAGRLQLGSGRAAWPLVLAQADRWSGPGWVVLGDAAHVVHPLAGQGLNLGLADVQALCDVLAARERWRPLGDEKLLRRYGRRRAAPTWAMRQVTDGLLHLFATPAAPVKELRNRGLTLVEHLPPLKRWLTSHALDS